MKITAKELLRSCEVQGEVVLCYYDEDKMERVPFLVNSYLANNEVRYLYVDDDKLYIEVEKDD